MVLSIFFRWLHIFSACLAIGGLFFIRFLVPGVLKRLEEPHRTDIFLRLRRRFKFLIHTCILFLVISGVYNSMSNWHTYETLRPTSDALWGTHVLLGLAIFTIALALLAPKEPPPKHRLWALVTLLLMVATLTVAASLKYLRDSHPSPPPSQRIAQAASAQ